MRWNRYGQHACPHPRGGGAAVQDIGKLGPWRHAVIRSPFLTMPHRQSSAWQWCSSAETASPSWSEFEPTSKNAVGPAAESSRALNHSSSARHPTKFCARSPPVAVSRLRVAALKTGPARSISRPEIISPMGVLPQPSFILSTVRSLMYDSLTAPRVKTGTPGETGQFEAKHRSHPRRMAFGESGVDSCFRGILTFPEFSTFS